MIDVWMSIWVQDVDAIHRHCLELIVSENAA